MGPRAGLDSLKKKKENRFLLRESNSNSSVVRPVAQPKVVQTELTDFSENKRLVHNTYLYVTYDMELYFNKICKFVQKRLYIPWQIFNDIPIAEKCK